MHFALLFSYVALPICQKLNYRRGYVCAPRRVIFFGARIRLGTILGRFSINYFSWLGQPLTTVVDVRKGPGRKTRAGSDGEEEGGSVVCVGDEMEGDKAKELGGIRIRIRIRIVLFGLITDPGDLR